MIYLGIDYGEKRIGLAKGQDDPAVATPFKTITNDENVFGAIKEIVNQESIEKIVVGVPVSLDGKEYDFAKKIREFGARVGESTGAPVIFVDETLTTDEASQGPSGDIDASAAALILQSFLDENR